MASIHPPTSIVDTSSPSLLSLRRSQRALRSSGLPLELPSSPTPTRLGENEPVVKPSKRERLPAKSGRSTERQRSARLSDFERAHNVDLENVEREQPDHNITSHIGASSTGSLPNLSSAISNPIHTSTAGIKLQLESIGSPTEFTRDDTVATPLSTAKRKYQLSWDDFVKLPAVSAQNFRAPSQCSAPTPIYAGITRQDSMVKPKGPGRPGSSLWSNATSDKTSIERFDLTSEDALEQASHYGSIRPRCELQQSSSAASPDTGRAHSIHRLGSLEAISGPFGVSSLSSAVVPIPPVGDSIQKNINTMMHGKPRHKPEKSKVTIDLEIEDIDDSDGDITHKGGAFQENSGLKPPRTAAERAHANKPQRKATSAFSSHFSSTIGPFTAAYNCESKESGGGLLSKQSKVKDKIVGAPSSRRASHDCQMTEEISEDEQRSATSLHLGNAGRRGSHAVKATSLSNHGDIQRTTMTAARRPMFSEYKLSAQARNSGDTAPVEPDISFRVQSVRTSQHCVINIGGKYDSKPCFRFTRAGVFHLYSNGKDISTSEDSLVIDPVKVAKISYCPDQGHEHRMYLLQNDKGKRTSMLLVLHDAHRASRLAGYIKECNPEIKQFEVTTSATMEQYFSHQTRLFDKWNKLSQAKASGIEDGELELLRAKREAKFHAKRREEAQTESDRRTNEISSETAIQPRKLKAHQLLEPERPVQSTRSTRSGNPRTRHSPTPPLSCLPRWTEQHPSWPDHWQGDSLVYPPRGDRRATVDKQDIVRLDEGEFLNDNLIWFYLRHLEERIKEKSPETAKRVYFMTPFFYQRLTAGKGRSSIDYDGVKRWTSKIDIFSYDYVIVPVNEHAHWYLAVICNTPNLLKQPVLAEETVGTGEEQSSASKIEGTEVEPRAASKQQSSKAPNIKKVDDMSIDGTVDMEMTDAPEINSSVECASIVDDEIFEDDTATKGEITSTKPKKSRRTGPIKKYPISAPRIITMDSLGYPHSPVCSNLRDFLVKEAKARKHVDITLPKTPLGLTAKNIPLQDNHCDCGLYLLIYVESVLANPDATIHDILQASPDVGNHFNNLSAGKMRSTLRKLIFRAKEEQNQREKEEKAARMRARKAAKGESSKSATPDATAAATSPSSSLTKVLTRGAFENHTGQHAQNDNCLERDNSLIEVSPPADREQLVKMSPHRVVHLLDKRTAPRDDPLEMEVDSPAAAHVPLESSQSKARSSADEGVFETFMDELTGAGTHNMNQPASRSMEAVSDRAASSKPSSTTSESVECFEVKPASNLQDEPEFTARNALYAQRAKESSCDSDADKSASDIHPSELSKRSPRVSMSPVQPPSVCMSPINGMSYTRGSVDLDEPAPIHINSDPEPEEDKVAKPQKLKQALAVEPLKSGIATSSQPVSVLSDETTMIPVKTFTPPQKKRSRPDHLRTKSPQHKLPRHIKFNEDGSDPSCNASSQDSLLHVMSPQVVRSSAEKPPTELELVVTPGRPVRVDDEDKDVDFESLFSQLPKSPARPKTSPRQHVSPTTGLGNSKSPRQNHQDVPQASSPRALAPAGFSGSPDIAHIHKKDDTKQKKSIEIVDID